MFSAGGCGGNRRPESATGRGQAGWEPEPSDHRRPLQPVAVAGAEPSGAGGGAPSFQLSLATASGASCGVEHCPEAGFSLERSTDRARLSDIAAPRASRPEGIPRSLFPPLSTPRCGGIELLAPPSRAAGLLGGRDDEAGPVPATTLAPLAVPRRSSLLPLLTAALATSFSNSTPSSPSLSPPSSLPSPRTLRLKSGTWSP
mmetsp:Transcript_45092/g.97964  ORF Transcript_45092/g.97964 Transcript_45092/m.97964 type:complete len:201 (+) Transcript_45092:788-1390(+)